MKKKIAVLMLVLLMVSLLSLVAACDMLGGLFNKDGGDTTVTTLHAEVKDAFENVSASGSVTVDAKSGIISITVESGTEAFDLSRLSLATGELRFYIDAEHTETVTGRITIGEGENTFYVTASKNNVSVSYIVKITCLASSDEPGGGDDLNGGQDGGTPGDENNPVPVETSALHPAKPTVDAGALSTELQQKLASAMRQGAADTLKAQAVMELYALANANKINAEKCVMVAQGDGTANVGMGALVASGSMAVRAFKVQNDGEYYYQKGAKLTNVSVGTVGMLETVLNKQERAYASADHSVCRSAMLSGASARVAADVRHDEVFSDVLPFIKLEVTDRYNKVYNAYRTEYTYEEFLTAAFIAEDPREIDNFQYHAEAIHDVTIRMLEDNGQSYYDIIFFVDTTDEATVKVARDYLRESCGSGNLEITYLKVNLRIWDNGYIHSYKSWGKWEGDVDLTDSIGGKSSRDTVYEATFYWDYDSLVADGILDAEDETITRENFTKDIINKYASQPGWIAEENTPGNGGTPGGDNNPVPVETPALHPAKPTVDEGALSTELQQKLASAMRQGAADTLKAQAVMELYALANANKINAEKCVMVAQGDGTANVGTGIAGASGEMADRAFKVQNDREYYYQKGAKPTNVSGGMVNMLEAVLNKQERAYCSADHTVCRAAMLSGGAARVAVNVPRKEVFSDALPFIKLDVTDRRGNLYADYRTEYTYEEFLTAAFIAEDPREIDNFQYHAEAIHDVTIRMLEDNGQSYYDIIFFVDTTDEATVKVARDYLRESCGSENLEITYLKVNLRIWDNGYIHSYKSWGKWEGDVDLTDSISGKSSRDTVYEATFYWDYDSLVADGILDAEDETITRENFTKDIINKYASQPGWIAEENTPGNGGTPGGENEEEAKYSEGLEYELSEDGTSYTVTGIGTCTDTVLVIPAEYEGKAVTLIGGSAFERNTTLESVTIPDSMTGIGGSAFSGCTNLTSVTFGNCAAHIEEVAFSDCTNLTSVAFGNGVTSIAGGAFSRCTGLTSIAIPSSVTEIDEGAFGGCTSLTSIIVDEGNAKYHSVDNCVIDTESKTLIVGCATSRIPSDGSVTSIGYSAFEGCTGLIAIDIPDSVTSIGANAFYSCSSLASIDIPTGVTSIANGTFEGCAKLASITIPNGVTSIGKYAFSECTSLGRIDIPARVTSIGKYAFEDCTSLERIDLPNGITAIPDGLVCSCTSLEAINIPVGVTSIGEYAFEGCTVLSSINIPDGVESIGEYAFSNCTSLTSITIPGSVTSVGMITFGGCTNLTSIIVSNGRTNIEPGEFALCTGLTSVVIPDSVESIGSMACWLCDALTTVYYGGSFEDREEIEIDEENDALLSATWYYYSDTEPTEEGNYWHYVEGAITVWEITPPDSEGLEFELRSGTYTVTGIGTCTDTVLVIPATHEGKAVTAIMDGAFLGNDTLTAVVIPASVTEMGWNPFAACTNLRNITVAEGNPKYHSAGDCLIETETGTVIFGCNGSVIPTDGSVKVIGATAFMGCTELTSVTIPASVETIEADAFACAIPLDEDDIRYGVLREIRVEAGNEHYKSVGGVLYSEDGTLLVRYPGGAEATSFTIPNGVTNIGEAAFTYCTSLTSITIPGSVRSIEGFVFEGCANLASITFDGTEDDWNAVEKSDYWDSAMGAYTVYFTGGSAA